MAQGLLRATSNQELMEAEASEARRRMDLQEPDDAQLESQLAAHIRKAWERNRRAKEPIFDRLIACLRARNGEYEPELLREIQAQGGSEIYMMLTATKCRAAASWVRDILLPPQDKAWGLEPTPVPDIPGQLDQQIKQRALMDMQAQIAQQGQGAEQGGQQGTPDFAELVDGWRRKIRKMAEERAQKAAENHERKMEDQLAEGNWQKAIEEYIEDFVTFPTAFFKGPVLRRRQKLGWAQGWRPIRETELRYEYEWVSSFDAYPAPYARSPQEGDFIERIRFSRGQLYRLIGTPGYSEEAIRTVLEEYGRGGLHEWLWRDHERHRAEGEEKVWAQHEDDSIDALHYWGSVQGLMLLEWGMDPEFIDDAVAEYEVEAILIGRHVIRAELNEDPLHERPYHAASYAPKPGSIWGTAIPELMEDIQRICNATARSLANNLAISSGPQVEVYMDRVAEGEDVTNIYPWKIWQMKSHGNQDAGTSQPPRAVNFYQPSSNANELLAVYKEFEIRADDATSIPRYTYGNERVGGAGQTASGLAMLMDSTAKGIRAAIGHIDQGVIRPAIRQQWLQNMLYEDDPSIKGDCKVIPRGSMALVAKEQRAEKISLFLERTTNDIDMQIMGLENRAKVHREWLKTMDMDPDLMPDADEIKRKTAAQNQQPSPEEREQQRKELETKAEIEREAAEHELEQRRFALEAEDTRFDNRLEAQKFAAEQGNEQASREQQERNARADRMQRERDAERRQGESS